jgi:CubicO group peptidase (beta-lactamase class C family)
MTFAPDVARELGRAVRTSQSERRLPSVSAAVARAGDVIWSEALGVADIDAGIETTPDTQYAVGSITKTFTAAAIMALRDEGALALDDTLGEHLPGVPLASPSLRRLLSHASGIQREIPGSTWEKLAFPDADELLAVLTDAEEILEPGRHWHYSNLAFALLGQVVSRSAEVSYERFVEERFLDPLELRRTTWTPEMPAAHGYFVEPYTDTARPKPSLDLGAAAAPGQLWSTATDLCRWGSFLASPNASILKPETAEEMATVQVMLDDDRWTEGWGLGVSLTRAGERVYAGHGGGMPGFLSGFVYLRKDGIAAAAVANATADMHGLAVELAGKVADAFPAAPDAWRPEADAAPPEIAGILGRWWSEGQETILSFRNGRLEARRADDPRAKEPSVFAPEEADLFRVVSGRERGEVLRVVRDEAGEPVRLYWATYPFFRAPRTFSEHAD